ncbi:MAG: AAA family ATPase [Candidatus Omnitrophota bacterium]
MSYYRLLGLEKEPFSTSPDPNFFYLSKEHDSALTNVLIELRLKRGLTVILGDIGTGKTTLSRKLIHELRQREDFIFYMLLNPQFESQSEFLSALFKHFNIAIPTDQSNQTTSEMMNTIERFLLQKAISEQKTLTLIVDEAQKVSESTLEILRVFLNFETNEYKLLQVVLLGQLELVPKILNMPNFYDRISLKYVLNPFDLDDTRRMIQFRLEAAGLAEGKRLFTDEAIEEVHLYTMGYPRRITMMCHSSLKQLIIKQKQIVDIEIIKEVIAQENQGVWKRSDSLQQKIY